VRRRCSSVASVASSTLILFIASLLVAASVAGTMTNGVERIGAALGDRSADVSSEIRTDIAIISDAGSPASIYNESGDGNLTLLVKNTGSQPLSNDPTNFEILLDGAYQTGATTEVLVDSSWRPGTVVRVTISGVSLSAGDHRVLVIVNGDREELQFRVPT